MTRTERLRSAAVSGLVYAIFWWCGSILDRPQIAWWKHAVIAVPLGVLMAGYAYCRGDGWVWPLTVSSRAARVLLPLWTVAFVAYAVYRNGPAQYVAAAILIALPLARLLSARR